VRCELLLLEEVIDAAQQAHLLAVGQTRSRWRQTGSEVTVERHPV
jgi:hypothetical protein